MCVGGTRMLWMDMMWRSCAKLSGRLSRSKANRPALLPRHSRAEASKVGVNNFFCAYLLHLVRTVLWILNMTCLPFNCRYWGFGELAWKADPQGQGGWNPEWSAVTDPGAQQNSLPWSAQWGHSASWSYPHLTAFTSRIQEGRQGTFRVASLCLVFSFWVLNLLE